MKVSDAEGIMAYKSEEPKLYFLFISEIYICECVDYYYFFFIRVFFSITSDLVIYSCIIFNIMVITMIMIIVIMMIMIIMINDDDNEGGNNDCDDSKYTNNTKDDYSVNHKISITRGKYTFAFANQDHLQIHHPKDF